MKHAPTQDPRTQERLDAQRQARESFLRDLRATFGPEHGQRVLAGLRAAAAVDRPRYRFPGGGARHTSPIEAAFHDGRASVVLEILEWLAIPEDAGDTRPKAQA